MRGPHNLWRLMRTAATFERSGASRQILLMLEAPLALRIAARALGWPLRPFGLKGDPNYPPILRAITALGPAYIKFGQILSTRADVVGPELAQELRILQDRLPPFSMEAARAALTRAFERDPDEIFESLSEPVAAASIAQVHKARLRADGREVAVKILRPHIEGAFRRDIDAFYLAAQMIEFFLPKTRRLRPSDVVGHFDSVVQGELDLRLEAAGASEFYENTKADEGFSLPEIYWPLTDKEVMTLAWVEGEGMGARDALLAAGHDLSELATRVLQMFLRHALRDGLFHADMHHGNLKVAADGTIIALDFGIMGRIDAYTRRVYAEILIGFIRRDYTRVAKAHFEAGYVPAHQDVDAFAQALRAVGEPIFGQDAQHISMAKLLGHLFDVTEQFGMETRTELILLQRTMVVVEGVARSLYPNLNIWSAARPVVEAYIKDNLGPRALLRDLQSVAITLARIAPLLPELIETRITELRNPSPVAPAKPHRRRALLAALLLGAALGLGIALAFGIRP